MRRFFVDRLAGNEKIVLITGKELHHLKDVLRLKKGDRIVVFDGGGREFLGSIESVGKGEACITIEKKIEVSRESPFEIILGQGIVKAEKMDLIIQKATELGVSRIIPFTTSRTVAKLTGQQVTKKNQRWQNIALEAAKQCGRSIIPKVGELKTFGEVLKGWDKYTKIIPWEGEKENNLKAMLRPDKSSGCIALIGPEGGFSDSEVVEAQQAGFSPVTLGPRILRTETAAMSIVAIIQYELGDMGS